MGTGLYTITFSHTIHELTTLLSFVLSLPRRGSVVVNYTVQVPGDCPPEMIEEVTAALTQAVSQGKLGPRLQVDPGSVVLSG